MVQPGGFESVKLQGNEQSVAQAHNAEKCWKSVGGGKGCLLGYHKTITKLFVGEALHRTQCVMQ